MCILNSVFSVTNYIKLAIPQGPESKMYVCDIDRDYKAIMLPVWSRHVHGRLYYAIKIGV